MEKIRRNFRENVVQHTGQSVEPKPAVQQEVRAPVIPQNIPERPERGSFHKMRENPWIISTLILGLAVIVLIFVVNGRGVSGKIVSEQIAAENLVSFIKSQSGGQTQGDVNIISTEQEGQLYKVTLSYQGQNIPVYVSLDGKYLISDVVPLEGNFSSNSQDNGRPVDVEAGDSPVMGDENAPVTIVEFSDFQCPFCGKFFSDTLPSIEKEYIKTGKVKLFYKDFPLSSIHPEAQKAAEAARCVGEQKGNEGYFKMHDKLFGNQQDLSIENYKKWARLLGVAGAKFDKCLDDGTYADAVKEDLAYGESLGVQGTPAFFINGKLLSGAQPFDAFKQVIDAELAQV